MRRRDILLIGLAAAAVVAVHCGRNQEQPSSPGQSAAQETRSAPNRSAFSPTRPAALASANSVATKACAADQINDSEPAGVVKVAQASGLKIVGWAVDDTAGGVPAEVFVELVSLAGGARYYAPAARLTKRPDVAKAHNNPAFENSGYDLAADLAAVPAGAYSVQIVQPVAAGVLTCDTRRQVEIHGQPRPPGS